MPGSIQFIGTQRSGSNLLRLILNQHSLISAPHPPHLLKTFFPLLRQYELTYGGSLRQLIEDMCTWVEKNPVPWSHVALNRELIESRSKSIIDIFEQIYLQKAAADNAEIWCCKSTFNIHYADELEKSIRPFYIHLYRDGRDVAASFKKVIVGHKHAYFLAKQWHDEQVLSREFLRKIEPKRKIQISYEALLERPDETVSQICSKLGLEYSSNMLRYYTSEESHHTAESGRMWEHVIEPIIKNNRGKFQNELTTDELKVFEKVAGETLQELGYELLHARDNHVILDIARFQELNQELILVAKKNASIQEIEKRIAQEEFLTKIRARLNIK